MPKKIRENLGLDKLFALIEPCGSVAGTVKRHKLAAAHKNPTEIAQGYANVGQFMAALTSNNGLAARLEDLFIHLPELSLGLLKSAERLEAYEFFELKTFLWVYAKLAALLKESKLHGLHELPAMDKLFSLLDPEGNNVPSFRISPLYSATLSKLSEKRQELSRQLQSTRHKDMEQAKNKLNMPTLKEEFILSRNRKESLTKILESKLFVVVNESLANYSFRLADSQQASQIKAAIMNLTNELQAEEQKVLTNLTAKVQQYMPKLETAWHSTCELLWDFTLAKFALQYGCCLPKLSTLGTQIEISQAVNLPLKLHLEQNQRSYQSLDICISQAASLITGPNMGGKSTALITIGQLCYLCSLGIPLPAKQALIPVFEEVYYNHDSGDNSETLSSFGREVVSLTTFLERKGSKLILLDEFAKGTNPTEGEAICVATLDYFKSSGNTVIAASHFTAPALLEGIAHFSIKGIDEAKLSALENSDTASLEQRLQLLSQAMDYSLVSHPGKAVPPRCAVRIAGILGLPQGIMQRLKQDDK